jgi:hypothetical protein
LQQLQKADVEREIRRILLKKLFAAVLLTAAILCAGCGGDKKLVDDGDTIFIDLPTGEKFVNFAHSNANGYVVHRKRRVNEEPEEYVIDLVHQSGFGHSEQISKVFVVREH